jgi:guanylate kinase
MDVRGDLQALDVEQLLSDLEESDLLFEGNPFVGKSLLEHSQLTDIPKVSAFMSPLSREEIEHLKNTDPPAELPALVTDVMRRKLLRRTRKQKGELSIKDLENIEKRAGSAFTEMQDAHLFDHVIPNHDGEDSENWDAFYHPLGDARKSLQAFVLLLEGKTTSLVEDWGKDLLNQ